MKKTKMIIISAPSGAGKSSFLDRILREVPVLLDTVTYTTREMRSGESEGNPYHFVTRERFHELVREGFFVEWAPVHDNFYGTPLHQIEEGMAAGRVVIMDVDVKGAETFKSKYPKVSASIFILPPSVEELKKRILGRDKKPPADLETRLQNVQIEMNHAGKFDYQVINDNFEASYAEFKQIILKLIEG
ncbi:MAG: guanylate kinase [Bdellovibrionales bacterium]|nr:guanylate kinase [Bdellovibrionales bacterium]